MRANCPSCGTWIVRASGSQQAKVLIVGEFPSKIDIERGISFATHPRFTTAGQVFRKELNRVGLSISQFRICNLWQHEPNKKEECYQIGHDAVLDEAKGKSAILLVGSEVVEAFTKYKVSDVSGLQVDSPILSAPIIYACVNPAITFHGGVGEIRFAIRKFVKRLESEGLA